MIERGDIQIAVCRGGYVVQLAQWDGADEHDILAGSTRVCVTIEEVRRLVESYIEAADAYGDGPKRAREDAEGVSK